LLGHGSIPFVLAIDVSRGGIADVEINLIQRANRNQAMAVSALHSKPRMLGVRATRDGRDQGAHESGASSAPGRDGRACSIDDTLQHGSE
jgi:hypothetical protein